MSVTIDIRQESTIHSNTLDAITKWLGLGSYCEWTEIEKQQWLVKELSNKRPLIPANWPQDNDTPPIVEEVLETFRILSIIGMENLGAYIISMARLVLYFFYYFILKPSDILAVELLQKTVGIENPLRVVPLFETKEDLENAAETIRDILSIDWYLAHIKGHQEVMLV